MKAPYFKLLEGKRYQKNKNIRERKNVTVYAEWVSIKMQPQTPFFSQNWPINFYKDGDQENSDSSILFASNDCRYLYSSLMMAGAKIEKSK